MIKQSTVVYCDACKCHEEVCQGSKAVDISTVKIINMETLYEFTIQMCSRCLSGLEQNHYYETRNKILQ